MSNSGIFGYINYLVEKDRKTILDTLVNGMLSRDPGHSQGQRQAQSADSEQVLRVSNTVDTTQLVWRSTETREMRCTLSRRLARSPS